MNHPALPVTTTTARADVIIVGGGLMGAATAFFARQKGLSVILLERDLVGQCASGTNFGNVRRQGRFLPQLPLANRSRAIWGKLPELIGEDVEFLPSGHVRVAFKPQDSARLEQYAQDCKPYGLNLELYSGRKAIDRFPMLAADVDCASFSPLDGHANPRLAAPPLVALHVGRVLRFWRGWKSAISPARLKILLWKQQKVNALRPPCCRSPAGHGGRKWLRRLVITCA